MRRNLVTRDRSTLMTGQGRAGYGWQDKRAVIETGHNRHAMHTHLNHLNNGINKVLSVPYVP